MDCLHSSTIIAALWNIIYSILQTVIFAWQTKYVKDRQISFDETINGFQALFPGLNGILTETPETRRLNALFALAITSLIVSLMHLFLSVVLFYGAVTKKVNFIWPWFFISLPLILLSTIYAIIWWSGDMFDTQLIVSVSEFILSLAINSICFLIVLLFFFRTKRTAKSLENANYSGNSLTNAFSNESLPWRNDWNVELRKGRKKMRQKGRSCRLLHNTCILTSSLSKESSEQLRLTAKHLAEHNRMLSSENDRLLF